MKRNGLLLLVIAGLTSFIYFYHEVGDKKRAEDKKQALQIFDAKKLGAIKSFSTSKSKIYLSEGRPYLLDSNGVKEDVDERKVQSIFDALSHIHVKKEISLSEVKELGLESFFTTSGSDIEALTFNFKDHTLKFLLGKKLDFDQAFYMKVIEQENDQVKTRYLVVFDQAALNVPVARKNFHRTDIKYRRFQSLLYLADDFFRDHRVFAHWMNSKWSIKEVRIENKRNRDFSISLVNKMTTPPPPAFLKVHLESLRAFEKMLVTLEGKKIQESISDQALNLGKFIVKSNKGEVRFNIFTHDKVLWLQHSENDQYYGLEDGLARLFLGHVQDFWDLRVIGQDTKGVKVSRGDKSKESSHKVLLKFLRSRARYMVWDDHIEDGFKDLFMIDWGNGPFALMEKKDEYLLVDRKKRVGLVYDKSKLNLAAVMKGIAL